MTKQEAIEYGQFWLDMNEDSKNSNTYKFFELAVQNFKENINKEVINEIDLLPVYTRIRYDNKPVETVDKDRVMDLLNKFSKKEYNGEFDAIEGRR